MRTWITGAVLISLALSCGLTLGCSPFGTSTPTSSQTPSSNRDWVTNAWLSQKVGNTVIGLNVTSHSMRPTMDYTSLCLVEGVMTKDIHVGDICLYFSPKRNLLVGHRVRQIRGTDFLFDGDDNQGSDGFIPVSQLRGRVAGILFGHP